MSLRTKPINIREAARKIEVDNRIPIGHYYRIASSLLQEANHYRQENNIIELYILLLRYASLLSETIPLHEDYNTGKNRLTRSYIKKLLDVLGELESLKPQVEREIAKVNVEHLLKEQYQLNNQRKSQDDSQASSSRQSPRSRIPSLRPDSKQESRLSLTLSIPLGTPGTVPSAPPIENLVISEDTPMPSGVDESSFVDSSSSTTENLLKRHDEESSSTTASSSCIICFEAPIEGACVPCGHMAGCMSCLNEIKAKSRGCPVCRTKIEMVLRLFAV